MKYTLKRDDRFYSRTEDGEPVFEASIPTKGKVYTYESKLVAEDIANRFNAEVVEIPDLCVIPSGTTIGTPGTIEVSL